MSRPESARMPRVPYSRLVAHFLRHLEATTSLALGGRLSEAPHDPAAAPIPATRPAETVGGSQPHGSRIGNGHPPGFALRASLDDPYRAPSRRRPTQPRQATPVRARVRRDARAREVR